MKLIIDIPEETYSDIQSRDWKNGELIFSKEWKAIHNGIPIPDNATNGDILKIVFPDSEYTQNMVDMKYGFRYLTFNGNSCSMQISDKWWYAPYQKGGNE